ncbi:MAG TPA: hypothetical protein VH062_21720 [Polyangiaceae bacterium]|nr:hypothetical protein [Polyangiaceae bacterium]
MADPRDVTPSSERIVHDEPPHIAHPARTLSLIALAIVALIAGGFGLRHVEQAPGTLPNPVQGR